MQQLPPKILQKILNKLTHDDLQKVKGVSRKWYKIVHDLNEQHQMMLDLSEQELDALPREEQLTVRACRVIGLITATEFNDEDKGLLVCGGRSYTEDGWSGYLYYDEVQILIGNFTPVEIVNKIISLGFDVTKVNPYNEYSLLHLFCYFLDVEVLDILCKKGCDLNAVDIFGDTILYLLTVEIMKWESGDDLFVDRYLDVIKVLQWLGNNGANFNQILENDHSVTTMFFEAPFFQTRVIEEEGAKFYALEEYSQCCRIVGIFLQHSFSKEVLCDVVNDIFNRPEYCKFYEFADILLENVQDYYSQLPNLSKEESDDLPTHGLKKQKINRETVCAKDYVRSYVRSVAEELRIKIPLALALHHHQQNNRLVPSR